MQDVTAWRKAEAKLRSSQALLAAALELIPAGCLFLDDEGKITSVNRSFLQMTGFSAKELKGRRPPYPFLPENLEWAIPQKASSSPKRRRFGGTIDLKRKDGGTFPARLSYRRIGTRETPGWLVTVEDLSREFRSHHVMQENVRFLQRVIDAIPIPIFYLDPRGTILGCNESFAKLVGKSVFEIIGVPFHRVEPADLSPFHSSCCKRLQLGDGVSQAEAKIKLADGNVRDLVLTEAALKDDSGKVAGIVGTLIDVTELKAVQAELERSRQGLEQLLAALPCGLVEVGPDGTIQRWNAAAEKMSGLSASRVVGKSFSIWGRTWLSAEALRKVEEAFRTGSEQRLDGIGFERLDGTSGSASVSITPITDTGGWIRSCVVLVSDITAYHELQEQLSESRRLESIGQLAAGIAHEINTPTQYVGDNTRFLRDAFQELYRLFEQYECLRRKVIAGEEALELAEQLGRMVEDEDFKFIRDEIPRAVEQSLEGVDRIAKIVQAMKQFAHPGSTEKAPADLNNAVETTVTVARNEWKYVADLILDLDPNLPAVPCNVTEINQVILNLVVNAAQAIEAAGGRGPDKRGVITVSTRKVDRFVEIRVADTGTGIPPEVQPKIFDPFFTTKEVGKGSGQGLSLVRSVVHRHGGSITFETEVGKGTTFIVRLPLDDQSRPAEQEGTETCRNESEYSSSMTT